MVGNHLQSIGNILDASSLLEACDNIGFCEKGCGDWGADVWFLIAFQLDAQESAFCVSLCCYD